MRLDKYIADNTQYSRAEVKRLVMQERIHIDERPAKSVSQHLSSEQTVYVDDLKLSPVGKIYIIMHKPAGYICATTDATHPTVMDLVSDKQRFSGTENDYQRIRAAKLQIVGRLDLDTTGLLLLTNDGNWNHRITSPKSQCKKNYLAELAEPLSTETIEQFANGILLRNEAKRTQPADLEIITSHSARVGISEGRYHQVKRMFAACNNKVIKLHRESIGALKLCNSLPLGSFRLLSQDETV